MINKKNHAHFRRTLFTVLLLICTFECESSTVYGVSFADYFPLDSTTHGQKTFEWTYGLTGSYASYISGACTVPYTSGAIEGAGVVNFLLIGQLCATNDGNEVKWLALGDDYISSDEYVTAHPASWTFSDVTDNMFVDQGTFYFVDSDLASWEMCDNQAILFDIQNITVLFGQYIDAVIIWWLDKDYTFTTLDFDGKDTDLGVTLPNGTQTQDYSVTEFDVYAYGVGLIAHGDIDAETGQLTELDELSDRAVCGDSTHPYPVGDLNHDCRVNLFDMSLLAEHWCQCTDPECD